MKLVFTPEHAVQLGEWYCRTETLLYQKYKVIPWFAASEFKHWFKFLHGRYTKNTK